MKSDELVLCCPSARIPSGWMPEQGHLALSEEALFDVLSPIEPLWLPRGRVESDPTLQQWIPYALILNHQGALAAYPRRGSEARLHGSWSLGIGGHVNPEDAGDKCLAGQVWRTALWGGLRRELGEEFPAAAHGKTQFLGLIHEALSEVGRVHLGAVFLHCIDHAPEMAGEELEGFQWIHRDQLGTEPWPLDRFELWSRLAIGLLSSSAFPPCPTSSSSL